MITSAHVAVSIAAFGGATCLAASALVGGVTGSAVTSATLVATVNAVVAIALSSVGARRASTKAFFGAVFGGMAARMASTLGALIVAVKVFDLPAIPFVVALLAHTALFTAVEVFLWTKLDFTPRVQPS